MKPSNPYHDRGMHKGAPPSSFKKAQNLRRNMTPSEERLWGYLKNKKFQGLKFRRQHPIHLYVVDFYCHQLGLIIEVDGLYHDDGLQIKKDLERSNILKSQNLHILRFSNQEVDNSIEKVLADLREYITDFFRENNISKQNISDKPSPL